MVHDMHFGLIVDQAPDPPDEQLGQDRRCQPAPARRVPRWHGGRQLRRVRPGEQVVPAAACEDVGRAVTAGLAQRAKRAAEIRGEIPHSERAIRQLGGPGRRQTGNDTVNRPDHRGIGNGVDEERQPVIPGAGTLAARARPGLQLQVGGIPVVPVRDERAPAAQVGGNHGVLGRVGNRPEPVRHTVVRDGRHRRLPGARHQVH
jgi:hypothetical protein